MPGRNFSNSPLRPGAPNYGNARGKAADNANDEIEKGSNPGVSPGSVPDDDKSEKIIRLPYQELPESKEAEE